MDGMNGMNELERRYLTDSEIDHIIRQIDINVPINNNTLPDSIFNLLRQELKKQEVIPSTTPEIIKNHSDKLRIDMVIT